MSESDVRLMWSPLEEWSQSDSPLDFFYERVWDPDIDYRAIEGAPDDVGPILGRDAMRAYFADWYESFDELAFSFEEVTDAGEGIVVVVVRMSGRAKASSLPTDMLVAVVYTLRDGKVIRGREYLTREEALKAAGGEG